MIKEIINRKKNKINCNCINENNSAFKAGDTVSKAFGTLDVKRLLFIILISIFISVLSISNISALGITPGRTTLEYEQGLEREIAFSILNSEYKYMQVSLTAEGELKDYITLSDDFTEFSTLDYSKELSYNVKLPDYLKDEPGLHTAEIVVLEIPEKAEGGTHIGATVAVVSQLYVYVSCPGKCIEADLNVLDAEEDGTAIFIVPVINGGEQKIEEAKAVIEIFSMSGEKIDEIETNTDFIEAGKRTELTSKWTASKQGDYIAKVTVFYDGESRSFEKQFSVGEQILDIERVWVSDFSLGGIAKFRILIENKWNQELKSVFANLIIYDKGYVMADVKSASENIPVLSKKELLAYWDTQGVEAGMYDGKLMIKYDEKSTDRDLVLGVNEDSLEIFGVGYAISPTEKGTSLTTILIILIVLLLIGNLAWFVFFRRVGGKGFFKRIVGKGKS